MKLKNKRTGKIGYLYEHSLTQDIIIVYDVKGIVGKYNSLAELNEEWEDYEETKEWYWFIEDNGIIQRSCHYEDLHPSLDKARKEIGNYFNTQEEAEKAVEKLKAWKRLEDKGIRIVGWDYSVNVDLNGCKFNDDDFIVGLSAGDIDEDDDLDLLFWR